MLAKHVFQLVVDHVALGDGKHAWLVGKVGVESAHLVAEDVVFLFNVVGLGWHHKEEHGIALDVAQEAETEAFALARTLDDTGNVSHHKRLLSAITHDAQVWLKGGERIVGDFWLGGRNHREQGAFTCVRETHQSHICQHLQLHNHRLFHSVLASLGVAWSLVGGSLEVGVAQTATAAAEQLHNLAVFGHIAEKLARLGIVNGSAARHFYGTVFAVFAVALVFVARCAVGGEDVARVFQVNQCPQVAVALQEDVTATTTVATIRTTLGHVFCTMQVSRAVSSAATATHDFHIVDKIRFWHIFLLQF